jgi:hypothetical protein
MNVVQQLHPFAGKNPGESIPALEGQLTLMEPLTALGSVPSINESARSFLFHRAANGDFYSAHSPPPRSFQTSDQKSAINCSTPRKT